MPDIVLLEWPVFFFFGGAGELRYFNVAFGEGDHDTEDTSHMSVIV